MKKTEYCPSGICARKIEVYLADDDTVQDVVFYGGCDGNHKGLAALCRGMKKEEVITRLSGIKCGFKGTSCPDQLAQALKNI